MTKVIVVDDEPLALDILKQYIITVPGLDLLAAYHNPGEALNALKNQQVDLLFLDIQMPGLTGLDLLRSLKTPPKVILTTAFREFAVEGFELEVIDYLVKPFSRERFIKALDKYHRVSQPEPIDGVDEPFIFLKVNKEMVRLKFSDVYVVEGLKNYVRIKTTTKDLVVYHTLSYIEDKFPARLFRRIHKSYIVNVEKIEKFTSDEVFVQNKPIPVGRMYQDQLSEILKRKII
jgi:DNA-binding LytR/AlgR family response regulator